MDVTFSQVRVLAKRLGAKAVLDRSGDDFRLNIEAPKGMAWKDGSVHELCTSHPKHEIRSMPSLYMDAISRMNFGLENCEDANCDWCAA